MGFDRTRGSAFCWRTSLVSSFLALHVISSGALGTSLPGRPVLPDGVGDSSASWSSGGVEEASGSSSPPPEALSRPKRELPEAGRPLAIAPRRPRSHTHQHLWEQLQGVGAGLPTLAASRANQRAPLDFAEDEDEDNLREDVWSYDPPIKADGSLLDPPPPVPPPHPHHHAHGQSEDGVIRVEFYDPPSTGVMGPEGEAQELQGGDPTSWTLSDFYDYLSPDYSTTEYPDDDDGPTVADMEDENLLSTTAISNRWAQLPGGVTSGDGGQGSADSSSGCVLGYVRRNGTCQSPCAVFTNYCFNGGQCYEVEGVGAFCRCNVQEYVWNKGTRCEAIITDFQVLCLLVGGASLTVLLLFMIVVFFAKRLHVLRQENTRLRRRSKYRPQSEHHDNFSVSTIAEGSQANKTMNKYTWECKTRDETYCSEEDPAKEEEPLKTPSLPETSEVKSSPSKEDEPLTIQNSVTPTHENSKPLSLSDEKDQAAEDGVTIDLELLLPKEVKMLPSSSPPLQYNVFLYKLPKSPILRRPRGRSRGAEGGTRSQLTPQRSPEPGYSPVSTRSLPSLEPLTSRPPNPRLGKACTP
ncbi:chondroitin sulfate proteoglycan 5b isoform X2 [Alosa alosa]|uniref:chondroitin sulfate proteoglycan 5b isoform X2 n=1 Tax=Alosa alosa TaxID=278164 RepID=UPI0020155208|nr:chondroitin sulfate proteoglycan 5b isoform X2 [Alosa alosa]